jgi:hypothetical protein
MKLFLRNNLVQKKGHAMPTPEEGKLEVNKQYQEAIKIVINLVTASLALPIVFLKNILRVDIKDIKAQLVLWAYASWVLLGISLLACVGFYVFSTKFTKAVYGMYAEEEKKLEKKPGAFEHQMEYWRDLMVYIAAPTAVAGLLALLKFFA